MTRTLRWMGVAPWLWCTATLASAGDLTAVRVSASLHVAMPAAVVDYQFVDGFEAQVDCLNDLACPPPASGQACLAGRIGEAGAGTPMRAFFHAERDCADGAIGGACNLRLTAYDALSLAADPATAPSLPANLFVDGCARFRITGLAPPDLGFVAIVADDIDPAAESDLHVPSAILLPVAANQEIEDLDAVVARHDSDARWTQSAGSPFGADSFADVGAMLFAFTVSDVPVAGVTVVRDGSTLPGQDYYFADATPSQRHTVEALLTATGANGSALVVNSPLANYSGTGSAPPGCPWPTVLSSPIVGHVVFVVIKC